MFGLKGYPVYGGRKQTIIFFKMKLKFKAVSGGFTVCRTKRSSLATAVERYPILYKIIKGVPGPHERGIDME